MNYSEVMSNCIEYIEKNIKENLTPKTISDEMGYSLFHFCRIFNVSRGISLMDYVKQRRLSLASLDLFKGKKVIDIAVEYRFETHGGFSKAFKKEFGFSPTQYKKRAGNGFYSENSLKINGDIMKPKIIKKDGFRVAGYGIQTDISDGNYTKDIASFWSYYEGENLESKMYEILKPKVHGEYGLCVPADKESYQAIYLLGVKVDNFENVTNDMITVEVPSAEYAVFTTPPIDTSSDSLQKDFAKLISSTWKYIFEEWFKNSEYKFDESKIDFEFYDERCHSRVDTIMEIYVPIVKYKLKE